MILEAACAVATYIRSGAILLGPKEIKFSHENHSRLFFIVLAFPSLESTYVDHKQEKVLT